MYLHILWSGPERKIIDATGKEWFFEMHRYCGPIELKKDGDPKERQPGARSQFWVCTSQWAQQGMKTDGKGHCIYEQDKEIYAMAVKHLGE